MPKTGNLKSVKPPNKVNSYYFWWEDCILKCMILTKFQNMNGYQFFALVPVIIKTNNYEIQ